MKKPAIKKKKAAAPGAEKKKLARKRPIKRATKRAGKRTARRNPETGELEQAAALSEQFHGRPAHKANEYSEPGATRQVLTNLGSLIELTVKTPAGRATIEFESATRLAASPDGGQLYVVGGDQSLDIDELGLAEQETKDHIEIGPVLYVVYGSKKAFDGFEPVNYRHRFGEDGGTPPTLCADRINDRLYFVGGTYQIEPQGITN